MTNKEDTEIGIVTIDIIKERLVYIMLIIWFVGMATSEFFNCVKTNTIEPSIPKIAVVLLSIIIVILLAIALAVYRKIIKCIEIIEDVAISNKEYLKVSMESYRYFTNKIGLTKLDYFFIVILSIILFLVSLS